MGNLLPFVTMERLIGKTADYEIVKTSAKEGFYYSDGNFKYIPPGWAKIKDRWYPLGYKVVTLDNKSLGLRKNPTIYTYEVGGWMIMPKDELIIEDIDEGGIFSGASLSSARKTQQYCRERQKDPFETKIFYAAIYRPFLANGYKVKSQGIMLLKLL